MYQDINPSGIGGAVNKAISTAELLKKDKPLHQTNRIFYTSIKEIWKPKDNEVIVTYLNFRIKTFICCFLRNLLFPDMTAALLTHGLQKLKST